jgi:hypothetical protein
MAESTGDAAGAEARGPDDDQIFDEIVEAIQRTAAAPSEAKDADDDGVRQRAIDIVEEVRDDETMREGMKDMQALSFSIGAPLFRGLFAALVAASTASDARKRQWLRTAKDADTGRGNVGCMEFGVPAGPGGPATKAYAVLRPCAADHDLGAQLQKLDSRLGPKARHRLREELSVLRVLGLRVFADMCTRLKRTIAAVLKKVPGDYTIEQFATLTTDPANTTMLTGVPAAGRIGIFIDLESEIETEKPGAGSGGSGSGGGGREETRQGLAASLS